MPHTITELKAEVTAEEVETMARIEGLIRIREGLRADQESVEELVSEIIEQRREELTLLGLDAHDLDEGLRAFSALFEGKINTAKVAQFEAVKSQRS